MKVVLPREGTESLFMHKEDKALCRDRPAPWKHRQTDWNDRLAVEEAESAGRGRSQCCKDGQGLQTGAYSLTRRVCLLF